MQSAENPTCISQIKKVKSLYQSLTMRITGNVLQKEIQYKKTPQYFTIFIITSFSVITFEHLERAIGKPQDVSSLHRVHLNSIQLQQIVFGNNTYNSILLSNPPAKVLILLEAQREAETRKEKEECVSAPSS